MAWLEKCHCGKKHRMVYKGICPHCGAGGTLCPVSEKIRDECGDTLCGFCKAAQESLREGLV